jgi:glutathione S-transferase
MSELILHHYAGSPFSEKVRLVLGYKRLHWRSVIVPVVMPKPDVLALTGRYRRTPFLQVGADIYCDTALICQVIEQYQPEPSIYPASAAGLCNMLAQWADSDLFWVAIPYTMQPAGAAEIFKGAPPDFMRAFAADRAAMTAGMKRPSARDASAQLQIYLSWVDQQLADGRPFLCGAELSVADFAVVQSVWYIRRAPAVAGILQPFAHLDAWFARVSAFGHGVYQAMTSAEAIGLAQARHAHAPVAVTPGLGYEDGEPVTVTPIDYAQDPVDGMLVGLSFDRITVQRQDERAGTVHVHFPRIGYQLRKAVD